MTGSSADGCYGRRGGQRRARDPTLTNEPSSRRDVILRAVLVEMRCRNRVGRRKGGPVSSERGARADSDGRLSLAWPRPLSCVCPTVEALS